MALRVGGPDPATHNAGRRLGVCGQGGGKNVSQGGASTRAFLGRGQPNPLLQHELTLGAEPRLQWARLPSHPSRTRRPFWGMTGAGPRADAVIS